jgi:ketosteroid isomerase-like protein
MRHRLIGRSLLALVLACGGCSSHERSSSSAGPHPPVASRESIAKHLTKLDDDWSAAAATRDADRVASFYSESAVAYPPGEPLAVGKAAARNAWASYFAEPTFRISWKTLRADASASGDMGFTSGSYKVTYNGADGKPVLEQGLCRADRHRPAGALLDHPTRAACS